MCLAVPGEVIELFEAEGVRAARVNFGGVVKQVCMEYTPEAQPGDYVLVHVGFALSRIDPEEAARTYKLLMELDSDEIRE
jgi:hydrogenase expression/formation protein HypC